MAHIFGFANYFGDANTPSRFYATVTDTMPLTFAECIEDNNFVILDAVTAAVLTITGCNSEGAKMTNSLEHWDADIWPS